jgi:formamidopyrimidine-DNA glycosylase|uniref:bifunctional DNA-formamidopyrimidine glycosylase/DNA-(apurinic or apyrimidinic site) lyase n=1 Tax=Candidatus Planktophila sp. TaxID=2175601 RepID=UPI00404B2CA5
MPELPEVETVRRGLQHLITGFRITAAHDLHPRALKPESIAPLHALNGAKITGTNRRGKFMWITLNRPYVLVAHLGMSGQFLIHQKDRPQASHIRAQFHLKKPLRNLDLVFNDQRTFGWLSIEELTNNVPTSAQHIAADPFDPLFDKGATVKNYARRNIKIKTALLNQEIMSGVGNIYADETLWRAKVHPEALTSELSPKKIATIIDYATEVMSEAIKQGGTSFDDLYINVNGESGFFEQSLAAYGQEDEPCPRCGTPIKRITFGARSSHFCPRCQKR